MVREFRLPDLGEGVHEGEIVHVFVSVGDEVQEDQPILEVETDKAAVEIPSPFAGSVAEIRVKEGDLVTVGDVLITFQDLAGTEEEPRPVEEGEPIPRPEEAAKPERAPERREGPVPASPATRRLARQLGVDLQEVPSTGPGGRVTSGDVRAFADRVEAEADERAAEAEALPAREPTVPAEVSRVRPSAVPVPDLPDFSRWGEVERLPLRSVRRATAKHMALAWSQVPHVSHQDVADVTKLEAFRQKHKDRIAEQGGSLTLTVFVMKAAAVALKDHPRFNASLDADAEEIVLKKYVHVGVAVDTERGLLVPVVRHVDRKSIADLAVDLNELVARTRKGEASLEDLQGGTFTITNPGPLGGIGLAPIVNYPEVAILGLARASWQPVVRGEGKGAKIVPRFLLPLALTFDHRVADGADAARFVNVIIDLLKDPDQLLLRV